MGELAVPPLLACVSTSSLIHYPFTASFSPWSSGHMTISICLILSSTHFHFWFKHVGVLDGMLWSWRGSRLRAGMHNSLLRVGEDAHSLIARCGAIGCEVELAGTF